MSELTKKRVRWFEKNKETDEILHDEDVDILTSAEATLFNDGESLQEKYDNGNIARTSQLGDLNALATTNNSNLVDAVNEVNASVSSNTKSIETLGEALDEINNELDNIADSVEETLNTHVLNKNNPHGVTKSQVGLGNVDNTSDMNKPISTATQNALNTITSNVSSLTTKVNTNTTNISNLTTRVTNVENAITPIQASTTDLTAGTSSLASGTIYCVYE